ncbi:DUF3107 domain-containing protein [Corynebacterium freiburgense]|uniref:DUF3107 domain-containing protein n=1 Tax=Corynebacterium freiburgense TaxID=556548 RepID=UPI0003FB65B8|nr:DUF3107 domain-containing protein [Corynebacterium freiburgense]WJZ01941.1 hypothetical protein CFREI_03185 [Corynebacterium freiburgense]
MDIKIGFSDSARELVVSSNQTQDEVVQLVKTALADDAGSLQLTDDKGRQYVVRNSRIAYVEIGTTTQRQVGFAG